MTTLTEDPIDQRDRCVPTLCALGTEPHAHCVCGLPMATDVTLCNLCRSEGLDVATLVTEDNRIEWDGVSYASHRAHRPVNPASAPYLCLLDAILRPDVPGCRRTTEEAA